MKDVDRDDRDRRENGANGDDRKRMDFTRLHLTAILY